MADVVKLNVYLVASGSEEMKAAVRATGSALNKFTKHLPRDQRPASTWVGVTTLLDPRQTPDSEACLARSIAPRRVLMSRSLYTLPATLVLATRQVASRNRGIRR